MRKKTFMFCALLFVSLLYQACKSQVAPVVVAPTGGAQATTYIDMRQDNREIKSPNEPQGAVGQGNTSAQGVVRASSGLEYIEKDEFDKPPRTIAGQLVYDANRKLWRWQIILSNGAKREDVTPKMEEYVKNINPPNSHVGNWEPYKYTIFATEGLTYPAYR